MGPPSTTHFVPSFASLESFACKFEEVKGAFDAGTGEGADAAAGLGAKEVGRLSPPMRDFVAIRVGGEALSSEALARESGRGMEPCGSLRRTPPIRL